jgi:hypothetical protein
MSRNECIVVFTAKSADRILSEGGTSSWRLDRRHARKCRYAICTRNANADWVEGQEEHHAAFLVGKVKDVVPSATEEGDWLVLFSEYARVSVPDVWQGDRNPVRYSTDETLAKLGLQFATLKWEPMPKPTELQEPREAPMQPGAKALTIAEAKQALALTFHVPPEAIEITIRG